MSLRMNVVAFTAALAALAASGAGEGARGATMAWAESPAPVQRQPTLIPGDSTTSPLERTVTATFSNARLGDVLEKLAALAHVSIAYTDRVVPVDRRVTATFTAVPLSRALETVLSGTAIAIRPSGDRITLVKAAPVSAPRKADGAIGGQVTDRATGEPVIAATITLRGTEFQNTTTDSGYYIWYNVPAGEYWLQVRMIGYEPSEQRVSVREENLTRVDVRLARRVERLSEVLVTATGSQRRLELGNDIVTINVDSVMATTPVRSVTDLLETRVPGLEVLRSSGAPGDPSRLRLRGLSSINRPNDPILVIDGIRMDIREDANRGLATSSVGFRGYLASSRLDQIDPNSIETIEVFRGPSASAMYGPDAANGVIVISTKRGRPGPTQWQASATQGFTNINGSYPVGLYRWGHVLGGLAPLLCPRRQYNCTQDSLVAFQALNDPYYSPFGQGRQSLASMSVRGGTQVLTYDFTGSFGDETGVLQLPELEQQRFQKFYGTTPPSWMLRPDRLSTWSGVSRLTAKLSDAATLDLVSTLSNQDQQHSSLSGAIGTLYGGWTDQSQLDSMPLVNGFERFTSNTTTFNNQAALGWSPRRWFNASANVGVSIFDRSDQTRLQGGVAGIAGRDTAGHLGTGANRSVTASANVVASIVAPLPRGMRVTTAFGMNLASTSAESQITNSFGVRGSDTPSLISEGNHYSLDATTIGWFLAPTISVSPRLHFSPGFRIDGGSTAGSRARFNGFPKLDVSWVASDEKFFPLRRQINTLRLRAAYGQAGVQPGPTDRLRLYTSALGQTPGAPAQHEELVLTTPGNTQLRPERSTEMEGGFDLAVLASRLTVGYTGYIKTRHDAIEFAPLAPSVGLSGRYLTNIGLVRNTGSELTVGIVPLQTRPVTLQLNASYSVNNNLLVHLAPGARPIVFGDGSRFTPGYPLAGRWAKPVLGYSDANVDGIIDSSEVVIGDSVVYLGQPLPKSHLSFATNTGLFGGRVSVNATFDYQHAFTQFNEAAQQQFVYAADDPGASLSRQAAAAALAQTPYGLVQTVNALRFNSLSVSAAVPARVAHFFGASTMSVALQGSNLGLITNYRGFDPGVSAFASGEGIVDTGQLPQPRTWSVSVRLGN